MKVSRVNEGKMEKWKYRLKNKLIFTYYLKLFLTLSHIIKLFYQTSLIYSIAWIKLLSHYKLLNWFTKNSLS